MPTVLVKEFFRNFSGIFPEKFRASYFSGKVTTLLTCLLVNSRTPTFAVNESAIVAK